MLGIEYKLRNAHNHFGKLSMSGEKAVGNNKAHNQVVNECIQKLNKKGFCICWYDEQKRDIISKVKFEVEVKYLDDEIEIRRI